jgi:hypothetical protein
VGWPLPLGAPNARIGAGVRGMEAFGGWEMSVREYASFYTRAFLRSRIDGSVNASQLMNYRPASFVIPGCTGCYYGLGVIVVPIGDTQTRPNARHNLFHHGDWSCPTGSSCNGATTPQEFASFAAMYDNIADFGRATYAFVIYDRHVSDPARVNLDDTLRNAVSAPDPTTAASGRGSAVPAAPPTAAVPAAPLTQEQVNSILRN